METAKQLIEKLDPLSATAKGMSLEQWEAWVQAVQMSVLFWVLEQGTPEEAPVNIKAEIVAAKVAQIGLDVAEGGKCGVPTEMDGHHMQCHLNKGHEGQHQATTFPLDNEKK